jgi:hypothetical protein
MARDPGDLGCAIRGIPVDQLGIGVEPGRRPLDELRPVEAALDDDPGHRIRQGDVRTDVDSQPHIGPAGRLASPGVDAVQAGTVVDSLEEMMEKDGMRRARVRTPEEDDIGVLDLLE